MALQSPWTLHEYVPISANTFHAIKETHIFSINFTMKDGTAWWWWLGCGRDRLDFLVFPPPRKCLKEHATACLGTLNCQRVCFGTVLTSVSKHRLEQSWRPDIDQPKPPPNQHLSRHPSTSPVPTVHVTSKYSLSHNKWMLRCYSGRQRGK